LFFFSGPAWHSRPSISLTSLLVLAPTKSCKKTFCQSNNQSNIIITITITIVIANRHQHFYRHRSILIPKSFLATGSS
jgi:hypothetical protein